MAALPAHSGTLAGITAGISAVVFGAGLGELAAVLAAPSSSPFATVGGALIDFAPPWAKDAAISLFGTGDKAALLIGIAVVALAVAALAGWLEARWAASGRVLVLALGAVGVIAATTRADAGPLAWLPSAVAGIAGALALGWLIGRLRRSLPASAVAGATGPRDEGRRVFFAWAGGATAVGVLAVLDGALASAGTRSIDAVRRALHLPTPAVAAAPVPAGAELDILALDTVVTPNRYFYRIDTALIVPQVDPASWSLRIHGMVDREVVVTWDELLALPLEESWTTLVCVSNPVGGDLIGNAKWLGYPIRHLLERAGPQSGADMVLSTSVDGFTASTPLEVLQDAGRNSILAVGMNGEPLPPEHGFPVRMVVPGLYGYVSATKWVTDLEVTRFDKVTAFWTTRGWSERGPIKLQSRIDVPRRKQGLSPGDTMIAGVAWQPHTGVSKVEVQVDGGPWREATLAAAISDDTWVQWAIPWTAEKGDHAIRCRATDKLGQTQTETDTWPAPDGATGWQQLNVTVA